MIINKKTMIVLLLGIFLVSSVVALEWSNPTNKDGSPIVHKHNPIPLKKDCPREEWNNNFEKFRNGLIPKDEMKKYVRSCK